MVEYICMDCGAVFEREETDYQVYHGCPWCNGDIQRAEHCEGCGCVIPEDKAYYHRCANCKKATLERFKSLLDGFSASEILWLEDYTDGRKWEDWRAWE